MGGDLFSLWRRQAALAGGFASMAPFAGFVMATRLARIAQEGAVPTTDGLAEAERMISEKVSAVVEGSMAATRVLSGIGFAATPLAAAGLMVAAGEAALRPASRTVKANARRLSRARR